MRKSDENKYDSMSKQWRSQPDDLVPLCNIVMFIEVFSFRSGPVMLCSIDTKIFA